MLMRVMIGDCQHAGSQASQSADLDGGADACFDSLGT